MSSPRARYFEELIGRITPLLILFSSVYIGSSLLFWWFERPSVTLFKSFYWGIVTLSTAGYGDIVPTNTPARVVTMVMLFLQIFLLGWLISVVTMTVTSEHQRRVLGLLGTELKGHIIVLGYSAVGRAAVRELLAQEQRTAVVAQTADEVANIRALAGEDRLYVTYGDPAEREILQRANIGAAHSVIVSTGDDSQNMIAALNVRALAPNVRVVVSVNHPDLREPLETAGVTYVTSPADLGGRLCAAAAFEPDVAHALEELSAGDVRSDIQEYLLGDTTHLTGLAFDPAALEVRRATGCLLVGYARPGPDGKYRTYVDPPADVVLRSGDAVVLLGTLDNTRKFRHWFGVDQGR